MERPQYRDMRHATLFWKCENYEAYAIACDMEGLTPIWDKSSFEDLKACSHRVIMQLGEQAITQLNEQGIHI